MAAIMLNVESDPADEEAQEDGQREGLHPRVGLDHEQHIRTGEAGEEDRRLDVHLPTVAGRPAAGSEIACDPFPKSAMEGRVTIERQPSSRLSRSKRDAAQPPLDFRPGGGSYDLPTIGQTA